MYGANQLTDHLEKETALLLEKLRDSWDQKERRVQLMQHILDT